MIKCGICYIIGCTTQGKRNLVSSSCRLWLWCPFPWNLLEQRTHTRAWFDKHSNGGADQIQSGSCSFNGRYRSNVPPSTNGQWGYRLPALSLVAWWRHNSTPRRPQDDFTSLWGRLFSKCASFALKWTAKENYPEEVISTVNNHFYVGTSKTSVQGEDLDWMDQQQTGCSSFNPCGGKGQWAETVGFGQGTFDNSSFKMYLKKSTNN